MTSTPRNPALPPGEDENKPFDPYPDKSPIIDEPPEDEEITPADEKPKS